MPKEARPRLQVELTSRHRQLLSRLRRLGGTDSDATRKAIELVESAADRIQQGYKMVAVPMDVTAVKNVENLYPNGTAGMCLNLNAFKW